MPSTSNPPAPLGDAAELKDAVKSYLRSHPDLLRDDPVLLAHILGSAPQTDGNVVDFQAHLIERFKTKTQSLADETETVKRDTRIAFDEIEGIHDAILQVLEAQTFESLIDTITSGLPGLLNVRTVSFGLESEFDAATHPLTERLSVQQLAVGDVDRLVGADESVSFYPHETETDGTGGPDGRTSGKGSLALLRLDLGPRGPNSLIALTSDRAGRFEASATIAPHYAFLAKVIAKLIRHWLRLPVE